MRPLNATAEQTLARIAGAQHGLVTRAQLLDAGVSAAGIQRRVRQGTLLPELRGVYRVGHRAPSLEADYLGAVLACGECALLRGRAAGHLFGILRGPKPEPDVSVPTKRRIPGVRTRRARWFDKRDATTFRGIPVTTVAHTLVDLAADLRPDQLARACHEAGVRYGTTPAEVGAVLARRANAPGARKLREVMLGKTRVTLSGLEKRFLELLEENGLVLRRPIVPPAAGESTAAGRSSG
jgi:hypothetical protein